MDRMKWITLFPVYKGNEPFHEDYKKLAGAWKIKYLRVKPRVFGAPYETGWYNSKNARCFGTSAILSPHLFYELLLNIIRC